MLYSETDSNAPPTLTNDITTTWVTVTSLPTGESRPQASIIVSHELTAAFNPQNTTLSAPQLPIWSTSYFTPPFPTSKFWTTASATPHLQQPSRMSWRQSPLLPLVAFLIWVYVAASAMIMYLLWFTGRIDRRFNVSTAYLPFLAAPWISLSGI